jgi:hypothetical protein
MASYGTVPNGPNNKPASLSLKSSTRGETRIYIKKTVLREVPVFSGV